MNEKNIVVNTLVFLKNLNDGLAQSELLKPVYDLEVNNIEIRREYIKDFDNELKRIKELSEDLNMTIYYSVPEVIYDNGQLNKKQIEKYFNEANKMNCNKVKLNIGKYNEISQDDVKEINNLIDKYSINLTIENDQTELCGKVNYIKDFLEGAKALGMKISFTFDIGNWIWQKEDPIKNAYILKHYVTYIHLKDVHIDNTPKTSFLDEGDIDWRRIINIFNEDIPIALEYPCENTMTNLKKEIGKLKRA